MEVIQPPLELSGLSCGAPQSPWYFTLQGEWALLLISLLVFGSCLAALAVVVLRARKRRGEEGPASSGPKAGPARSGRASYDHALHRLVLALLVVAVAFSGATALALCVALATPSYSVGPVVNISMTGPITLTCDGVNASAVDVGASAISLDTTMLGFHLILAGASGNTPPGTAGRTNTTGCGIAPPLSGWIVLLLSPGGSTNQAYYDASGWHSWNATVPVAIQSGQTIEVIAAHGVSLVNAVLSIEAAGECDVVGFVTL